jgi:hypothetical protein
MRFLRAAAVVLLEKLSENEVFINRKKQISAMF